MKTFLTLAGLSSSSSQAFAPASSLRGSHGGGGTKQNKNEDDATQKTHRSLWWKFPIPSTPTTPSPASPTESPTASPTESPTASPTESPTASPTLSSPMAFDNDSLRTALDEYFRDKDLSESKYGPIADWDVSQVTSFKQLFYSQTRDFNEDISGWDTSRVTDMAQMFYSVWGFNQDLGSWNTSSVTSVNHMFCYAESFNGNVGDWDTSSVLDMDGLFRSAEHFNQDIGGWDTSSVTNMGAVFSSATSFNRYIGDWDTSKVTRMYSMFAGAQSFNQYIGGWDTSKVLRMDSMFYQAQSFNQYISDWDTSSVTAMNRMFKESQSFNKDIGDWDTSRVADMSQMFYMAKTFNQDLGSWDTSSVTSMNYMFYNAQSFNGNVGDWDTSSVSDMDGLFHTAKSFNQYIGEWDTSSIRDMSGIFIMAEAFNQDIGGWDTSKVTMMNSMFARAQSFNQYIGDWDTSSVTAMKWMFKDAQSFDRDIGDWDTSSVTSFYYMFEGAQSFNQDIRDWNTISATSMGSMFKHAKSFSQGYLCWLVEDVQDDLSDMFEGSGANSNSVYCPQITVHGDGKSQKIEFDSEYKNAVADEFISVDYCPSAVSSIVPWKFVTKSFSGVSRQMCMSVCRKMNNPYESMVGTCEFAKYKESTGDCEIYAKRITREIIRAAGCSFSGIVGESCSHTKEYGNITAYDPADYGKNENCNHAKAGEEYLVKRRMIVVQVDSRIRAGNFGLQLLDFMENDFDPSDGEMDTYTEIMSADDSSTSYHCQDAMEMGEPEDYEECWTSMSARTRIDELHREYQCGTVDMGFEIQWEKNSHFEVDLTPAEYWDKTFQYVVKDVLESLNEYIGKAYYATYFGTNSEIWKENKCEGGTRANNGYPEYYIAMDANDFDGDGEHEHSYMLPKNVEISIQEWNVNGTADGDYTDHVASFAYKSKDPKYDFPQCTEPGPYLCSGEFGALYGSVSLLVGLVPGVGAVAGAILGVAGVGMSMSCMT